MNMASLSNGSLGRILRIPLRLVPRSAVVPVLTGPLRGSRWRVGAATHGCWIGTYEAEKVAMLSRRVPPGGVAYDLGANAGYYTLLLSKLVGPSGQVFAFEPYPPNVVNLVDHIRRNHAANCTVIEAAVADAPGLVTFQAAPSPSMGRIAGGEGALRVSSVALDDLVENHGLPVPDLVKMDVEGAEGAVLRGARRLLARRTTIWFIALHGDEAKSSCEQLLRANGYHLHSLAGESLARPLVEWSGDEIYAVPGPLDHPDGVPGT